MFLLKCKIKHIVIFLLILLFSVNTFRFSKVKAVEGKQILAIGSYNVQNEWEKAVLQGFYNILGDTNIIHVEYIDCNTASSDEYYESFFNYLNTKYNTNNIDAIFLMDDEAVNFIRSHMFEKNAFCYHQYMLYVGVNETLDLSNEEKQYLSGINDIENPLNTINVMLDTKPDLKKIYLLTDESQYCQSIEYDINELKLSDMDIDVEIIRINSIEHLKRQLENLSESNAAILLCGTYTDTYRNSQVQSTEVLKCITNITNIPVYTTLYSYVKAGAIGGIVNDGIELGKMGGRLLKEIVLETDNPMSYILSPPQRQANIGVFNFKAIRDNNINPLDCPRNSIFINKPKYGILLPEYMIRIFQVTIVIVFVTISFLIILAIKHKKFANAEHFRLSEAQRREAIKTDYIIMMSHELRTPLNIIKSVAALLKLEAEKHVLTQEYLLEKLDIITKNSNRLNRTINHSIDVAKLESSMMNLSFKMYNIVEVTEDVTADIKTYAENYNIEIIFDTNEEEIYTAIDKKAICMIMLNLLSNAIKSIQGHGYIYVNCNRIEDSVTISVKDTGSGISTEAQEHIFEKFYQVKNSYVNRNHEGTGIGLFIVKQLVDIHGGNIVLNSQLGVGSEFIITLPIKVVDEYPDASENNDDIDYLTQLEFSDFN